ncbi:hypothetical protein D3C75_1221050 [compost metagenome]
MDDFQMQQHGIIDAVELIQGCILLKHDKVLILIVIRLLHQVGVVLPLELRIGERQRRGRQLQQ